jgi:xylulokinase
MQIKADVLGIPFDALEVEDAGTVGCAMMAGVASGAYRSLGEAKAVMVKKVGTYVPDTKRHELYAEVFARYKRLYPAIRPLV